MTKMSRAALQEEPPPRTPSQALSLRPRVSPFPARGKQATHPTRAPAQLTPASSLTAGPEPRLREPLVGGQSGPHTRPLLHVPQSVPLLSLEIFVSYGHQEPWPPRQLEAKDHTSAPHLPQGGELAWQQC